MDFGSVAIESTFVKTLQVLNNSDTRLSKPKISVSSPVFDAVADCDSIPAKGYCTIKVTFSPVDLATANASLYVDGRSVPLAGIGVNKQIETPPDTRETHADRGAGEKTLSKLLPRALSYRD